MVLDNVTDKLLTRCLLNIKSLHVPLQQIYPIFKTPKSFSAAIDNGSVQTLFCSGQLSPYILLQCIVINLFSWHF